MSDGYYDYQPLLHLDRHLVLAGLVGEDTRAIGYRISALFGLNYLDLERQIEHRSGQSIESILVLEGEETLRQLEAEAVDHLLRDRPFGIVVLGDGTLLSRAVRLELLRDTSMVSLELSLEGCYDRCRHRWLESGKAFWHPLFPEALVEPAQVEAFWRPRMEAMAQSPYRLPQPARLSRAVDAVVETVPGLRPS